MSKRPGDGGPPTGAKRPYGGPGQEFMDSEPMLPEEYEDPDDEDVFLNDVLDQKVAPACSPPSLLFLNDAARRLHAASTPDRSLTDPRSSPAPSRSSHFLR